MKEKFKYVLFLLCNIFIGCLAGWLSIYSNVACALTLVFAYVVSLLIFNEVGEE